MPSAPSYPETSSESRYDVVLHQFDPRADAYLTSSVHASGPDLTALVDAVPVQGSVLDIGCGSGHVTFAMAPRSHDVVATDVSPAMTQKVAEEAARRGLSNVSTRCTPVESLPFDDNRFDVVVSRYSAHHWDNLDVALREAKRVLRPGGVVAMVDTVSSGNDACDSFLQGIEILRDCSHVRDRTVDQWTAAFRQADLVLDSTSFFRIRLEFASWIGRMKTPEERRMAILSLQKAVAPAIRRHWAVEDDGSFQIDVGLFVSRPSE